MHHKTYQRRLAVIMSADVAGYARLTELNEVDIHNILQKRLELIREHTSYHNGEVLRIHGDGCLCSFDSVLSAFKASLEIQQTSNLLNASLPLNSQIWFRIGIHLSEVIIDETESYGNGVNIATRLQQNSEPGEILVSNKTIQSLDHSSGFNFSKPSKLKFKNISKPISACKLLGNNLAISTSGSLNKTSLLKCTSASLLLALILTTTSWLANYDISLTKNIDSATKYAGFETTTHQLPINYIEQKTHQLIKKEYIDSPKATENQQPNLDSQLANLISKVDTLNNDIYRLQSKLNNDNAAIDLKIKSVANILVKQESQIELLLDSNQDNHFIQASSTIQNEPDYSYEGEAHSYEPDLSPNYISKSIDSLNEINPPDNKISPNNKGTNKFGCLSCSKQQPNSLKSIANSNLAKDKKRNTAILFGKLTGNGADKYRNKSDIIDNYLFIKLQDSIKQSALGANIEKFTHLVSSENQDLDHENIAELCNDDDNLLIARYELIIDNWSTTGTYLHFYNCNNNRVASHLEKNLAPTISNVQKPYLANDTLQEVNKSIYYMVDKLKTSQSEFL